MICNGGNVQGPLLHSGDHIVQRILTVDYTFNSLPIKVIDSVDFMCVHRVNGMCVVDLCVVDLSTTEFPLSQ